MGKRVHLGNDPFVRGAAPRPPTTPTPAPAQVTSAPPHTTAVPAAPETPTAKTTRKAQPPVKDGRTSAPAKKQTRKIAAVEKREAQGAEGQVGETAPPATALPPEPKIEPAPQASAPPPSETKAPLEPKTPASPAGLTVPTLEHKSIAVRMSPEKAPLGPWAAIAKGAMRAAQTALGLSGAVELDDYGMDSQLVRSLRPITRFLYDRYWRVEVEGEHHIPSGPVVLVANHSGGLPLDGPVLSRALQLKRPDLAEPRWLVEDQVFHAPFLGVLLNRLGAVRACPENAIRLLGEGRPLLVFPEGVQGLQKPYRERYQLKRFGRGGFVKIALRTGAPIIPVGIVGAEEAFPLLAKLPGGWLGVSYLPLLPLGPVPLPSKWIIRFGEPIVTQGAKAEDFGDVGHLTEKTREAIQGLLREGIQARRRTFG